MSDTPLQAVIRGHVRMLRLPALGREYEAVARRARAEGWAYEEYVRELLEIEMRARHENVARRLLRQARFPDTKTLDALDWEALVGISRPKIRELATCQFVAAAQDIVLAGPIGTGKTHLAIALGVEAARRRIPVAFIKAAELVRDLMEARDERTLGKLHRAIALGPPRRSA